MTEAVDVLVVGAGPTGLLLAAELHRRGIDCLVIDAHANPMDWDRATVVHPRSLEIFEALGIVDPLLARGVKQRGAKLYSAGSLLGEIDLSLCGSRYGFNIGISEEVTEGILTEYLERHGGVVSRSTKLVDLDEGEDEVAATLERQGVRVQIAARWVVGCDGHQSTVRQLAGIKQEGHDIVEPWAVFDATVVDWPNSFEANYAYLDETPVILTALPAQRWRVYLRPSSPSSDLVDDAVSTLKRYLPRVRLEDVANPTRFHCHTKVAKQFREGRLLLAGDAAHTCSPAQGHGMNSGLQDAFNLSWKLALVCQGACSDSILDSYEAERRPVALAITASGDEAEGAQSVRGSTERAARDAAIHAVFADPDSRHHEAVAEAELDIDYSASPIVMGDRHDALAPGQRLPDSIEIHSPGSGAVMLKDLTNRQRHTAVLIGGPSATAQDLADLDGNVRSLTDLAVIEATLALTTRLDGDASYARLSVAQAAQLGIDGVTLLLIRPDGHVGLRADRAHVEAVAAYGALLGSMQG